VTDRLAGKPGLMRFLLFGLIGVLVVYVGTGFVRQAQVREQQRAERARIEEEILFAQQVAADLEEQLEFVESSAAVEVWALENGWARPDEMPVVLIAPPGEPSKGSDLRAEDEIAPVPQQAWWDLFFGDR